MKAADEGASLGACSASGLSLSTADGLTLTLEAVEGQTGLANEPPQDAPVRVVGGEVLNATTTTTATAE